jgi:hypothetical protein
MNLSKGNIISLITIFCCLFSSMALYAQQDNHSISEHDGLKGSHRLSLGLGHTQVSKGKIDGDTKWLAIASWSFNYDYWIADKWAIGLQNDLLVESFVIKNNEGELIERSYPWAVVPVAMFKPGKHFTFIGGVGAEFSKGHNLALTRLGVEYGFHLPKNWEVGAAFVWDNKWNYYNSWGIAFTVSKIWPKKVIH